MDASTTPVFNRGYTHLLGGDADATGAGPSITLGLMTPIGPETGHEEMVPVEHSIQLAQQAEQAGFRGLWVRDVPLAIPQGLSPENQQAVFLDDPFLILGAMAQATSTISIGTAATVLPLRHPLHVAKSALTLDRLSGGRFVLGIGSGDRPEEFEIFGKKLEDRRDAIRQGWSLLRAALSPEGPERTPLLEFTGGHAPTTPPPAKIPLIAVGSARQTVQWIVRNADGWATYYRPAAQQVGRLDLWNQARESVRNPSNPHPLLISSMALELTDDTSTDAVELGVRTTSQGLIDHLHTMRDMGINHVILNPGGRPVEQLIDQIGSEVLPHL
ncbi:TIGR03571 family LLM class oxidoreductase [uncultured Corynebacterium sp.]|uniref:TIGR03571 family LLM class oxidoreductase n=1 Tax=uncultured Corynebacterium sp. TaxID=159447 RepID=UPI0025CFF86E|nr:TIGR03571 family LLM class oxidoreductase [uncultured Corynebacterium sp.]